MAVMQELEQYVQLAPCADPGLQATPLLAPASHCSPDSTILLPQTAGQAWVLQLWELGPEHGVPPLAGAGQLHVLVCVPPPQGWEQELQAHQPPLTGPGGHTPQSVWQLLQFSPLPQMPLPQQDPQSPGQLEHVSPLSQTLSPQDGAHAPQSCAQLLQLSALGPPLQKLSPQTTGGHSGNSQSGGTLPRTLPSGHMKASVVQMQNPQSREQFSHVSAPLQVPSPHHMAGPQSAGQLKEFSGPLHNPSPQKQSIPSIAVRS
jgi:hypothetical protein